MFLIAPFSHPTHLYDGLFSTKNSMLIDHADDGHTQVAADAERDTEAQAREDGNDVAAWQTEACAVHDRELLLLHQLWPALRWQLNGLSILLTLLKDSGERRKMFQNVNIRQKDRWLFRYWKLSILNYSKFLQKYSNWSMSPYMDPYNIFFFWLEKL